MQSKNQGLLIAIITIVSVFLLSIILFSSILASFSQPESASLPSTKRIDILNIQGEIGASNTGAFATTSNHQLILSTLDTLIQDGASKGLILFIESPGGSIYATDEIYLKLLEYKETGRPIYASLGSVAASGGYYLATAADKIICNRNTLTGSIGVIMPSFLDISGFLSKNGIKVQTLTAGKNKGMGNIFEPMTEEQLHIYAELLKEAHEQFIDIVSMGRKLDKEKVRLVADGRIFSAKQALNAQLVDELGTLDDTIALMKEDYDLLDVDVHTLDTLPKRSALHLLAQVLQSSTHTELDTVLALKERLTQMGYYCMSPLIQ